MEQQPRILPMPLEAAVRAVERLQPANEDERAALARALRLDRRVTSTVSPEPARPSQPEHCPRSNASQESKARAPQAEVTSGGTAPDTRRLTRLIELPHDESYGWPSHLLSTPYLNLSESLVPSDGHRNAEPLMPLRTKRGIFIELMARMRPIGKVDVAAYVRDFARGLPLQTVPRLKVRTIANGGSLIIDLGPSMKPFQDDVTLLTEALTQTVGENRISYVICNGSPPTPGVSLDDRECTWQPPANEPVIILSDLGLVPISAPQRRVSPFAWASFARELWRRSIPVTVMAPLAAHEIPKSLTRHLAVIRMDPFSTARTARHARESL